MPAFSLRFRKRGSGSRDGGRRGADQRLAPDDPSTPYALAVFYSQTGRQGRALEWAEKRRELRPMDGQVHRLIAELQAKK